jgi:hypothetical protein
MVENHVRVWTLTQTTHEKKSPNLQIRYISSRYLRFPMEKPIYRPQITPEMIFQRTWTSCRILSVWPDFENFIFGDLLSIFRI